MATAQFEVRDANGNVILNLGSRTLRLLTTADVGTTDGSQPVAAPVNGTPEFFIPTDGGMYANGTTFTINGQTLYWSHSGNGGGVARVFIR